MKTMFSFVSAGPLLAIASARVARGLYIFEEACLAQREAAVRAKDRK
jgi:hypothetical protein